MFNTVPFNSSFLRLLGLRVLFIDAYAVMGFSLLSLLCGYFSFSGAYWIWCGRFILPRVVSTLCGFGPLIIGLFGLSDPK